MIEFTDSDILSLLDRLKNQCRTSERCLISRVDVDEGNSVSLPCGHVYHHEYYTGIRRRKKCPYCGALYNPVDLERKCSLCDTVTSIRNGKCEKHNRQLCQHVIKRGKRAGSLCQHAVKNNTGYLCGRHTRPKK